MTTTARTPPGQLSWPAWEALRSGPVLAAGPAHPQADAVRRAGGRVELVPADELAERAATAVRAGAPVVVLAAPDDDALAGRLEQDGTAVEVVVGAVDAPGARLLDVVAVMDRLRSPGGCLWDARQTHASLRPYLLEEAYEAYSALEDDDLPGLREELGDVLLQVVFHARLAEEGPDPWSVDDVAAGLVDKLVRRHPHVFAGAPADDLEGSWDALKAAEKGRTSVTEGVPLGQPALSLAAKLQRRAERLGAPVPAYTGAGAQERDGGSAELGGELWELVRRCRAAGVDPEAALRAVARRHRDELSATERAVRATGDDPARLTAAQWAQRWPRGPEPAGGSGAP